MSSIIERPKIYPSPATIATGIPSSPYNFVIFLDVSTTQQPEARQLGIIASSDEITEVEMVDVEESLQEIREDKAKEFKNPSEALRWLKE